MVQNKQLDFSGTTIYCGVDMHKKNWRVNVQDNKFELEDFIFRYVTKQDLAALLPSVG